MPNLADESVCLSEDADPDASPEAMGQGPGTDRHGGAKAINERAGSLDLPGML